MLRVLWIAAALLVVVPCAWIASLEWFSRDDFAFLVHVQRTQPWSWSDVFLPLEQRFWPFYRPLGMESYFWACFQLFGLDARGYFAVSLAVHFASAGLVYAVARQWGFARPAALAAALLSASRPPSLTELYYGSIFHYVASRTLGLAALALFQRDLRTPSAAARAGSCAALALALLCNEVNALAPLVLVAGALACTRGEPLAAAATRGLRRALPQAALVGAWLVLRFGLLAPSELREIHTPSLGPHVAANAWENLLGVFGGPLEAALAALVGAMLAAALARGGRGAPLLRAALRTSLAAGLWLALAAAPFALLPFPQLRYGMLMEVPASLLFAAWLDAGIRGPGARHPRAAELALVALCAAAIPFAALAERARDLQGVPARRLVEAIEALPGLHEGSRVAVLYGAPGLADAESAMRLRYLVYNGAVLPAVHPESGMSVRFHDLAQRPPRAVVRPGTRHLALLPGLVVAPADAALLHRELPRGADAAR